MSVAVDESMPEVVIDFFGHTSEVKKVSPRVDRNPDGDLDDPLGLHNRSDEDADEYEEHERVDDVEEVRLPRGPRQDRRANEQHVTRDCRLKSKVKSSFVWTQAGVERESTGDLGQGKVRRERDVDVDGLRRLDGERLAVQDLEAVALARLTLDFEAGNVDRREAGVLGLEKPLDR